METEEFTENTVEQGIIIHRDFETIRQLDEGAREGQHMRKVVWIILGIIFAFMAFRAMFGAASLVLEGRYGGIYILEMLGVLCFMVTAAWITFFEIGMPSIRKKCTVRVQEMLKLIQVNYNLELMQVLERISCQYIRRVYMDENGYVCVQGRCGNYQFVQTPDGLTMAARSGNYNTELEQEIIASRLLKQLVPDAPINAYETEKRNVGLAKFRWSKMAMTGVILILFAVAILDFGIGGGIASDGGPGFISNSYIQGVKNGSPRTYPDITYGDAFENFFSNGKWKYFESEDGRDVVEFHGNCRYINDEIVDVGIQFIINEDDTFSVGAMQIDGENQSDFVIGTVILKVFEEYQGTSGDTWDLTLEEQEAPDLADVGYEENATGDNDSTGGEIQNDADDRNDAFYNTDLKFPIMAQGYTETGEWARPCPVMVNEISAAGGWKTGTYEEFLASCINDGVTMYAPPGLDGKEITTATKWDAPDDAWYDSLLTYEEFMNEIHFFAEAYADTGSLEIQGYAEWQLLNNFAGRFNNGGIDFSASIYSDFEIANSGDQIGTWNIESAGVSGNIYFLGLCAGRVYVICEDYSGREIWMYLDLMPNSIIVKQTFAESGLTEGDILFLKERYWS